LYHKHSFNAIQVVYIYLTCGSHNVFACGLKIPLLAHLLLLDTSNKFYLYDQHLLWG